MRKYFILIFTIVNIFCSLCNNVLIWGDGTIIFSCNTNIVDSITFSDEDDELITTKNAFSVGENKKINFAHGNLQYNISDSIWRFAEEQWEIAYIDTSLKYDEEYQGWIESFKWSTDSLGNYGIVVSYKYENTKGLFLDWGNQFENEWRTLSNNEWYYLTHKRDNADSLLFFSNINNINGIVLLPDDFKLEHFKRNSKYELNEWTDLEKKGAVFLPASGSRGVNGVQSVNKCGYYWTSTSGSKEITDSNDEYANYLFFNEFEFNVHTYTNRSSSFSVRLVKDKK